MTRAWRPRQIELVPLPPSAAGGKRRDACPAEHRDRGKIETVEGLTGRQPGLDEMPLAPRPASSNSGNAERSLAPGQHPCGSLDIAPQLGNGRQTPLMQQ